MTVHPHNWIDAYLDGELTTSRKRTIDSHLEDCLQCMDLLLEGRALKSLLQSAPPAAGLKPKEQFIAEIQPQLEPRIQMSLMQRPVMKWGLYLIPITVLFSIGFIHSMFILTSLVSLFPGAQEFLADQISMGSTLLTLPAPWNSLINLVGGYNILGWNSLTGLLALVALSLVYISWIAGWWLQGRQSQLKKIGVRI